MKISLEQWFTTHQPELEHLSLWHVVQMVWTLKEQEIYELDREVKALKEYAEAKEET